MRMKLWHRVAVVVAIALLVATGVVAYLESQTEYQVMSISGYAFRLEDGEGTEIFSVTDAGNTTVTGTLTVDDIVTFNASLATSGDLETSSDLDVGGSSTLTGTLAVGGDITMENDETLSNSTDGVVQVGGNLALTEGAVVGLSAGGEITPLGSFQPITSSAAITATIADGSVAGQILMLTNENAGDNITLEEASYNAATGGDVVLAGGNDDGVILLWTGDEWIKMAAFGDN